MRDESITESLAEGRIDDFFTVKIEDKENADRTADRKFLESIAATSGTFYRSKMVEEEDGLVPAIEWLFPITAIGEIPDLVEGGDVPVPVSVSKQPVWASWLMLLLVLIFLCVEWIVRKSRKLI